MNVLGASLAVGVVVLAFETTGNEVTVFVTLTATSVFFSSTFVAGDPNVKPVGAGAGVVAALLLVVSTGLAADGMPKLNVVIGLAASVLSMPNLNPPVVGVVDWLMPNLNCGPEDFVPLACGCTPGLGVSQHTHCVFSAGFRTIQLSHSQLFDCCCFLMKSPKPGPAVDVAGGMIRVGLSILTPGLGDSQAIHFTISLLLRIMHAEHSQVPSAALNWLPKPLNVEVPAGTALVGALGLETPGLGVVQATHAVSA